MGSLGSTGLIVLTLFGTPLFVVIVAAAFLGFYVSEIPSTVIAIEMYRLVETPMLMALPLSLPLRVTSSLSRVCPSV